MHDKRKYKCQYTTAATDHLTDSKHVVVGLLGANLPAQEACFPSISLTLFLSFFLFLFG